MIKALLANGWIMSEEKSMAETAADLLNAPVLGWKEVDKDHLKAELKFLPKGIPALDWTNVVVITEMWNDFPWYKRISLVNIDTGEKHFFDFTANAATRLWAWTLGSHQKIEEVWKELALVKDNSDRCSECNGSGDSCEKDRHGEYKPCAKCGGMGKV